MQQFRTLRNAVAAMFVLNGAFFGAWASRIPALKQEFNLSPDELGLLLLLLAGGAIISFPIAGTLSDRFGADRICYPLIWAYSFALIALGLAPNIQTFSITILLFGITHGSMDVAMNSWGADVEAKLKQPIMPGLHAMFSLGAGLGAGFGVIANHFELGVALHFTGFAVIVAMFSQWMVLVDGTSPQQKPVKSREFFALPRGVLILVGLLAFCAALGEGAMADWSAVYLTETTQASAAQAAFGYTIFSGSMVIIRLMGNRVIANYGPVQATRLSGITAALGTMVAILSTSPALTWIAYALMGAGFAILMPLAFSRAAQDTNGGAGQAIAAVATLGYGGMLLGPVIIGFVASWLSFRAAFGIVLLLSLAIIALAFVMRKS